MAPDQPGPDGRQPNRITDYVGEPWVWIFVAFVVVAALSVRFVVQPSTSTTGAASSTTAPRTTPPPTTAPAVTTVPPPTSEATPSTSAPGPSTTVVLQNSGVWTMPDERGEILSAAKDHIESIADGYEVPVMVRDASGQNRRQIIHQNWKVCDQRPAAGQKFTPESGVAFGVVKTNETCPDGRS